MVRCRDSPTWPCVRPRLSRSSRSLRPGEGQGSVKRCGSALSLSLSSSLMMDIVQIKLEFLGIAEALLEQRGVILHGLVVAERAFEADAHQQRAGARLLAEKLAERLVIAV